ncbi:hypothetical protein BZA02_102124 [Ruegeria sp. P4]|nr:hypothetical protein BZA02_102124 [Ruegeria sp. P4]
MAVRGVVQIHGSSRCDTRGIDQSELVTGLDWVARNWATIVASA